MVSRAISPIKQQKIREYQDWPIFAPTMDTPVRRRKENRTGQNKTKHHGGSICIQKRYFNEAAEKKEISDGH